MRFDIWPSLGSSDRLEWTWYHWNSKNWQWKNSRLSLATPCTYYGSERIRTWWWTNWINCCTNSRIVPTGKFKMFGYWPFAVSCLNAAWCFSTFLFHYLSGNLLNWYSYSDIWLYRLNFLFMWMIGFHNKKIIW